MRDMLDIWPEFPISIEDDGDATVEGATNVVNALKLNDRVSRIKLWNVSSSEVKLERVVELMQDPFPTLTCLSLWSSDVTPSVISDSFLGGSAPRLQNLWLDGIPFPALPNLLLSATDLVHLRLWRVPHSGYISPEAMVSCLSALTRLEEFVLGFHSPRSRPSRTGRLRRPLTRTILPALTQLRYKGVTEYLEDLVARIDIPLLQEIEMTFFNQLVFDISQLPKFVTRTATIATLDQADVVFYNGSISIELSSQTVTVDPANSHSESRAAFISCTGLQFHFGHPLHFRPPRHSRGPTFTTPLARRHRDHPMAGTFPPLHQCEESSPIQASYTLCRTRPERASWGTGNRSVTRATKSFYRWPPAVRT